MPTVSMRQLLEAGMHFGHQTRRWNPKMRPYIFAERNGIHIIDLAQTAQRLEVALDFVRETVARGELVLFVGTKKQAQEPIAAEAVRANMPFVNKRWLGGMLTNFVTIRKRIGLLEQLEARQQAGDFDRMTKKEAAKLTETMTKLQLTLGGMRKMKRAPGAIFVIDPHRERIAVTEANKLEIPVIGTGDTNVDPDELDYIIPANDDAIRSIRLLCSLVAEAAIEGASERAVRAEREPEVIEAIVLPEEDEEPGAADELVAALAGGAALTFEPDADEEDDLLPGDRVARAEAAAGRSRGRGNPRGRCRRARPRSRRGRRGRAGNSRDPGLTPGIAQTRTPRPPAAAGREHHRSNERAWRRSLPDWSRNCASAPAPASWTASVRWRRPGATSTRPSRCCASAASRPPRRRPGARLARA